MQEIREFFPNKSAGQSDDLIIKVFYKLRLIKYFTLNQAKLTNSSAYKICTQPIFEKLCQNGWLENEVITPETKPAYNFLKDTWFEVL